MATKSSVLLETLKTCINDVIEPYPGYRDELYDLLAEIIFLERSNTHQRINIVQKIQDRCEDAGKVRWSKTDNNEATN